VTQVRAYCLPSVSRGYAACRAGGSAFSGDHFSLAAPPLSLPTLALSDLVVLIYIARNVQLLGDGANTRGWTVIPPRLIGPTGYAPRLFTFQRIYSRPNLTFSARWFNHSWNSIASEVPRSAAIRSASL
jgi:hypothetical protein